MFGGTDRAGHEDNWNSILNSNQEPKRFASGIYLGEVRGLSQEREVSTNFVINKS